MAFTERVRSYNTTGKLPMYIILLDQHFFEGNKSRLWIELLEDPLRHRLRLPAKFDEWEDEIARLQDDLRKAVDESLMLQVEKNQYGEKWLYNRIRVQVNITNPADYSFYSVKTIGKLPIPDNNMRDHRKIVFYDVTEGDPYRGMAMFTAWGSSTMRSNVGGPRADAAGSGRWPPRMRRASCSRRKDSRTRRSPIRCGRVRSRSRTKTPWPAKWRPAPTTAYVAA
jgi:hypothetical protein